MSPQASNDLSMVLLVGAAILGWYLYQIASRKQKWLRYKLTQILVATVVYAASAIVLTHQRIPSLEVILVSGLAGIGSGWILVRPPRGGRRVPKGVREQVIARDLTSRGLKWDSSKYHIDHIVPFSRGGDNSLRNLKVVEKRKNLHKGNRLPSFWDLLGR